MFWYANNDERIYDQLFDIKHSDCYFVYGLERTGCVGCPYNKKLDKEIAVMEQYEPKLAIAAKNVFKDSYEYTKQYREFCKQKKINNIV